MNRAKPKAICFIDGSNLHTHLLKKFGSGYIRLPELCHTLVGADRFFKEWRYYAAPLPQGHDADEKRRYAGQQKFFSFVHRHRKGVLKLGRFQRDKHGQIREKGVDVLLAVDLIRLAAENEYDVAIVLSGDGDLVPAVDAARTVYRKRVEVAMPDIKAFHIREAADEFQEITQSVFDAIKIA